MKTGRMARLNDRLFGWIRSVGAPARFLLPLSAVLLAIAAAVLPLIDGLATNWFVRDLDMRARLVANTLQEPVAELMMTDGRGRVGALFERSIRDERLFAIALCDANGFVVRTITFPAGVGCGSASRDAGPAGITDLEGGGERALVPTARGSLHVAAYPVDMGGLGSGRLLLVHDMSFIERRSTDTKVWLLGLIALLGLVAGLVTLLVAHLSWRGWVAGVRAMLRGEGVSRPFVQPEPEIQPLVGDLRAMLARLDDARRERDRLEGEGGDAPNWRPDKLRRLLREHLHGDEIIVVSNREPYSHERRDGQVKVNRPASGLVTAVEPVMRACSGTWVAHGSGSADRETADGDGRLAVPPDAPPGAATYTLRRVWLSEEEVRGHYEGFSNEGLWPLCHIAHVRPVFRLSDWERYREVNERFADTVAAESRSDDPVILVQDYHFALLPRMLRERLPDATIITFWHIPWPNPESFGICPWREEILDGLLGSTIVGFHTRTHGRNFIETVDRYLESRIEHEHSLITHRGETTLVQDYPISIHWPSDEDAAKWPTVEDCGRRVRARLGLPADHRLGLGVDRLDYTKGILERFLAVEALLERQPQWRGRFTLVQIAAPSRASLDEYRNFDARVREEAERINARFADDGPPPIALLVEHHDTESVFEHYRAADVCVVTSLHDGMNLVAKEFIAARDDEQGVLILSQFAGAARELQEALIVNPYYIEETGDALGRALAMGESERRVRMRALRLLVRDFNVYRWAGRMILDAARQRQRTRVAARIDRHAARGDRLAARQAAGDARRAAEAAAR